MVKIEQKDYKNKTYLSSIEAVKKKRLLKFKFFQKKILSR
jgi:hypothetical protein